MRLSNKKQATCIGWALCPVLVACSLQMPKESDVFSTDRSSRSAGAGSSAKTGVSVAGASAVVGGSTSGATYSDGSDTRTVMSSSAAGNTIGGNTNAGNTNAGNTNAGNTIGGSTTSIVTNMVGGASTSPSNSSTTGNDLVAHFPFDDSKGSVVANATDSARNGSYVGSVTHPTGKAGNAVQVRNLNSDVSGTSDWIELPTGLLSSLSAATVALWVMDLSPTRQGARAFDFGRGPSEQFYFSPHETNLASSTEGSHLVVTHAGTTLVDLWSTSPAFTDKAWHHVAVSWSSDILLLYVDGRSVGQKATPGVVPSDLGATTPNWLGRCLNDVFVAFYGQFDDLRIYDRALSPTEITALYQSY